MGSFMFKSFDVDCAFEPLAILRYLYDKFLEVVK